MKEIKPVTFYDPKNKEGWNLYQRQYQQKRRSEMKHYRELIAQLEELGLLENGELLFSYLKELIENEKNRKD